MTGDPHTSDRWLRAVSEAKRPPTLRERIVHKLARALPAAMAKYLEPDPETPILSKIDAYAASHAGVTFVQIGSCDGQAGDPLREHAFQGHWRGLVVEPVPANFARLQQTYRSLPSVLCRNVALSTANESRTFYCIDAPESANVPSWAVQIGSFDRDHLVKHAALFEGLDRYISSIEVECMDLSTLLQTSGLDHIDILHTDVEGFDLQVLKQIDFTRWKPELILFEDFHMSNAERQEALNLLSGQDYAFVEGGMNVLAIRRSRPAEAAARS